MNDQRPTVSSDVLGFTFTEVMAGHLAPGVDGFREGAREGKRRGLTLWFRGTATFADLGAFLRDPRHRGDLSGTAGGSLFGGAELPFSGGEIALFAPTADGRLRMEYRFDVETPEGPLHVEGYKDVHNDYVVDFWPDTTRLFVTAERTSASPARWSGVLTITPLRLVPQVLSFRGVGSRRPWHHPMAIVRFLWFFSSTLMREYLARPRRASSGAGG